MKISHSVPFAFLIMFTNCYTDADMFDLKLSSNDLKFSSKNTVVTQDVDIRDWKTAYGTLVVSSGITRWDLQVEHTVESGSNNWKLAIGVSTTGTQEHSSFWFNIGKSEIGDKPTKQGRIFTSSGDVIAIILNLEEYTLEFLKNNVSAHSVKILSQYPLGGPRSSKRIIARRMATRTTTCITTCVNELTCDELDFRYGITDGVCDISGYNLEAFYFSSDCDCASCDCHPPDPTLAPTAVPTSSPTNNPTNAPTNSPICNPTNVPTAAPSPIPSASPTSLPSVMPSASPSAVPSVMPSAIPSGIPTTTPSSMPSVKPSAVPSSYPTVVPSSLPSGIPSSNPSTTPSSIPSNVLTAVPTAAVPLSYSTGAPSSYHRTLAPSTSPSVVPSLNLSSMPSSVPSIQPTTSLTSDPVQKTPVAQSNNLISIAGAAGGLLASIWMVAACVYGRNLRMKSMQDKESVLTEKNIQLFLTEKNIQMMEGDRGERMNESADEMGSESGSADWNYTGWAVIGSSL